MEKETAEHPRHTAVAFPDYGFLHSDPYWSKNPKTWQAEVLQFFDYSNNKVNSM